MPTSTTGAASPPPRYSSTMNRGSCTLPWDTASSAPIPSARSSAGPEHRDGEPVRAAERLRLLRQIGGRADVARLHLQAAREQMTGGDRFAPDPSRFRRLGLGGVHDDVYPGDGAPQIVAGPLELDERPAAVCRALHRRLGDDRGGQPVARLGRDAEGKPPRPQAPRALGRHGGRPTDGVGAHVTRLAHPDEQDASRLAAAIGQQHSRRACP